jgi:hypothetical protein
MTKNKLFVVIFINLAIFGAVLIVRAATCGENWNGYPTKYWGDGYCWAKVYKIETNQDTQPVNCGDTVNDSDGNSYASKALPTLNQSGVRGSVCVIGPLKKTKNIDNNLIKENNGIIYYSLNAATKNASLKTLEAGAVQGICPIGYVLPTTKIIEEINMAATGDGYRTDGGRVDECWDLGNGSRVLACTKGWADVMSVPAGYYKINSWYGLEGKREAIILGTTVIPGTTPYIQYYFYSEGPNDRKEGLKPYWHYTDTIRASYVTDINNSLYGSVFCVAGQAATSGDTTGGDTGDGSTGDGTGTGTGETGIMKTWYRDLDGDGYGNPKLLKSSIEQLSGYVDNNTDCNDGNKNINPGLTEICNNKIDEDCSGQINNGCTKCYPDKDNDKYGQKNAIPFYSSDPYCTNVVLKRVKYITNNTDCNDSSNAINPGIKENTTVRCHNKKDDDCDGYVDNKDKDCAGL